MKLQEVNLSPQLQNESYSPPTTPQTSSSNQKPEYQQRKMPTETTIIIKQKKQDLMPNAAILQQLPVFSNWIFDQIGQWLHDTWFAAQESIIRPTFHFIYNNRRKLLETVLAAAEDPITSGIGTEEEYIQPNCLTLNDFGLIEQGVHSEQNDIQFRWQLCLASVKKQPSQQRASKSKALICSRQLFPGRSISRIGHSSKESVVTELDDEDFDSVSTTSGIFTPFSSSANDPTKINALEQQLAALQKQMSQLLAQQGSKQPSPPSSLDKPSAGVPPPPPAPPLLPSLKNELLRVANNKKPNCGSDKLDSDEEQISPPPLPLLPQPQLTTTTTTPTVTMVDILKDIGNVKLKKVNRESPVGPLAKSRKPLENDKSLAGALARALDERRKKLKLDSEDGDDSMNNSRQEDEAGEWTDEEENNGEQNENIEDDNAFIPQTKFT